MRDRNIFLIVLAFVVIGPFGQPNVIIPELRIFRIVAVANHLLVG